MFLCLRVCRKSKRFPAAMEIRNRYRKNRAISVHSVSEHGPCPYFPWFFGKKKNQGKPPKNKDFLIPTEPLKSLEAKRKNKEFQKTMTGRTGESQDSKRTIQNRPILDPETLRLLNALNSEDRGLKVRCSLATIAFDRESAQMSQILSSQGKNAPSNPYPHYLVRLATSRKSPIQCY